ncbi:MAG: T9SS type A sorting domain-containing protein [Chitinophagales bacterium]|nr:T9SS type A sorting domain-containing protein [Chitinophagales bacterium]
MIWTQYYKNGNNYNYARTLHLASKGEYIISGTMASYPPYDPAGFIFKTDTSGNILWSKKFQTADSTFFSIEDFIETSGGLYCYAILEGEVGILQLDTSGNLNWCKKYQDLGEPEFNINMRSGKLHSTADSNYVLVNGSCWISAIAKFDSSGNLIFANIVIMAPIDVLETTDNGYLIIGDGPMCAVKTEEDNGTQIAIIKTDSFGYSPLCMAPLNYIVPIDQNILSLDVTFTVDSDDISSDISSNIFNVELSTSEKCVDQPSFVNETQLTPSINIFPNPAASQVTIEINKSANTSYKIQLIDLLGKKQITLDATDKKQIDISMITAGVYIIQCTLENSVINSMLVVAR